MQVSHVTRLRDNRTVSIGINIRVTSPEGNEAEFVVTTDDDFDTPSHLSSPVPDGWSVEVTEEGFRHHLARRTTTGRTAEHQ